MRKALTIQQRRIGLRGKVIMVGRDIGTVVLPEADLKIYLDASVEERAQPQVQTAHRTGRKSRLDKILKKLEKRDKIDSTREVAPLCAADDAVIINTDNLDIAEVVSEIERIALAYEEGIIWTEDTAYHCESRFNRRLLRVSSGLFSICLGKVEIIMVWRIFPITIDM